MFRFCNLLPVVILSLFFSNTLRADDWPQWLGLKRDSVWRETGILDKFPDAGPKVLWRTTVAGGYAGPAVAGGKVYVADFLAPAETREAGAPDKPPEIAGQERILCF